MTEPLAAYPYGVSELDNIPEDAVNELPEPLWIIQMSALANITFYRRMLNVLGVMGWTDRLVYRNAQWQAEDARIIALLDSMKGTP